MQKIILISGEARSGKDTLAEILTEKLDGKCMTIAMADYLKIMAKKYFQWDGEKDERGRTLLQRLGTEKIREELGWHTFHVERVCQDIEIIKDNFDFILIPDVRFRDEMFFTMAKFPYDTVSMRMTRPHLKSNLTEEQRRHRSENDLVDFTHDYYLVCDEGIPSVIEEVDDILGDFIQEMNREVFFMRYG